MLNLAEYQLRGFWWEHFPATLPAGVRQGSRSVNYSSLTVAMDLWNQRQSLTNQAQAQMALREAFWTLAILLMDKNHFQCLQVPSSQLICVSRRSLPMTRTKILWTALYSACTSWWGECIGMLYLVIYEENESVIFPLGWSHLATMMWWSAQNSQKCLPTEGISALQKTSGSWVSFIFLKQKRSICVVDSFCLLTFLLPLPIITSHIFCLAEFCLLAYLGVYEWVCCIYKEIWILPWKHLSIDCMGSLA